MKNFLQNQRIVTIQTMLVIELIGAIGGFLIGVGVMLAPNETKRK